LIANTSDMPVAAREASIYTGITIAEYFRDRGRKVLFMMDSLTRFAMAQREVGLAIGELPVARGYTPSVYVMLPRLLERTGCSETSSITAIYTVLVEGDDMNEPISDTVRGILDGHVILSRKLAAAGHYPAIDVLNSISRVMVEVVSREHNAAAIQMRNLIASFEEARDLINIGAYKRGSNPKVDAAIDRIEAINDFLTQGMDETSDFDETVARLIELVR